jgi:hypothetical protein
MFHGRPIRLELQVCIAVENNPEARSDSRPRLSGRAKLDGYNDPQHHDFAAAFSNSASLPMSSPVVSLIAM